MTLMQMRYFMEVCRWESISRAAQRLHVAQPTLSVAMKSLEQETGLNLFQHEKNRIILTSEAKRLLSRVGDIVAQIERLETDIQNMAGNQRPIRLAMPVQLGFTFLPAILGDFCLRHPEIELDIVEMGGVAALRMVENDRLDLAFTNFHTDIGDNLTYSKLFDCECFFCTWPDNPLAREKSVAAAQIAAVPLVMLDHHFVTYRLAHENFAKHNCRPHIIHYTPYLHTAKNLVRQHIASTILIRQSILPEDDQLVLIPLADPFYLTSGIVVKKGRQIYPHEQILMDYFKEIVKLAHLPGGSKMTLCK